MGDHETWFLNMETANADPEAEEMWEKLYSAKKLYQLENLSPSSWHRFIRRLEEDPEMFSLFYFNYHAGSSVRPDCDPICKRQILCNLKTSQSHNSKTTCNKDFSLWSYLDIFNWFY